MLLCRLRDVCPNGFQLGQINKYRSGCAQPGEVGVKMELETDDMAKRFELQLRETSVTPG